LDLLKKNSYAPDSGFEMFLVLVLDIFKKSNEPDTGIEMFLVLVLDLQKNNHMSLILVLKCFRRFNIGLFHYFMTTAMSQVSS
jgi:hypothetical protein